MWVVERTSGGTILIDPDPHPDGRWIPWPGRSFTRLTEARHVTALIPGEQGWAEHSCR